MKMFSTDNGYEIKNNSETMTIISEGLRSKANTTYQGKELLVKVKITWMHLITPSFFILENGQEIGAISRKYFSGNFIIEFSQGASDHRYVVKASRKRFELVDANKQSLLTIHYDYSITQQKLSYQAETTSGFADSSNAMILTFYTLFCLNYYSATGKGTMAS